MAKLAGNNAPTKNTVGVKGDIYTNTTTGQEFECVGIIKVDVYGEANDYIEYEWKLIEKEEGGGSGGAISWNDIPDKPFGEEVTKTNILDVDESAYAGNGYEGFGYYKMSGDVLTAEEIKTCLFTATFGEQTQTQSLISMWDSADVTDEYICFDDTILFILSDNALFDEVYYPKGIYSKVIPTGPSSYWYFSKIECANPVFTTTTIKPLDNKYIDAEWVAKEEVTKSNVLEWDGDTTGLTCVHNPPSELYWKISDDILTDEEIKSCTVFISSGEVISVMDALGNSRFTESIVDVIHLLVIFVRESGALCDKYGLTFEEVGIYCMDIPDMHVNKIECATPVFANKTITPLPEKYLPKEAIKAIAEEVVLGGAW